MKKFSQIIQEMALGSKKFNVTEIDSIIESLRPYEDRNIIWRGMRAKGIVATTTPEDGGFYGAIDDVIREVIGKLFKGKRPVFATESKGAAQIFADKTGGSLYAWIPGDDFTIIWNPEVEDLAHVSGKKTVDELLSGYKRSNSVPPSLPKTEILIQEPESKFVNPAAIISSMWDSDMGYHPAVLKDKEFYNKFKSRNPHEMGNNIIEYGDLIKVLEIYKEFIKSPDWW